MRQNGDSHGEWRSLVAHSAGGRAVAGSNPVSPIHRKSARRHARPPQTAIYPAAPGGYAGCCVGISDATLTQGWVRSFFGRLHIAWGRRVWGTRQVISQVGLDALVAAYAAEWELWRRAVQA